MIIRKSAAEIELPLDDDELPPGYLAESTGNGWYRLWQRATGHEDNTVETVESETYGLVNLVSDKHYRRDDLLTLARSLFETEEYEAQIELAAEDAAQAEEPTEV